MIGSLSVNCKYCQSPNAMKFGSLNGIQRYFCKICKRKFVDNQALPKMRNSVGNVADTLNMYYEGMALSEIRDVFIQQHNTYLTRTSLYSWVQRFTQIAVKKAREYHPEVGSLWVADEAVVDIAKRNVWIWYMIDTDTRFLVASQMSLTRTSNDAERLMVSACERAGKIPRVVYADRLRACLKGAEHVFGGPTSRSRGSPFDDESFTNAVRRFHSTLKEPAKVMRSLHSIESAARFLDGWLVHYNYFRPHPSLKDRTPAEVAGVKFPFSNWKDVCEAPLESWLKPMTKLVVADRYPSEGEQSHQRPPMAVLQASR